MAVFGRNAVPVSGLIIGCSDSPRGLRHCQVDRPTWISPLLVNTPIQYYICSPRRYTTSVMVEYLFTISLTARHVSDLQVHPQERL